MNKIKKEKLFYDSYKGRSMKLCEVSFDLYKYRLKNLIGKKIEEIISMFSSSVDERMNVLFDRGNYLYNLIQFCKIKDEKLIDDVLNFYNEEIKK